MGHVSRRVILLNDGDIHLCGLDFERAALERMTFDVELPVIATPREIVRKFFVDLSRAWNLRRGDAVELGRRAARGRGVRRRRLAGGVGGEDDPRAGRNRGALETVGAPGLAGETKARAFGGHGQAETGDRQAFAIRRNSSDRTLSRTRQTLVLPWPPDSPHGSRMRAKSEELLYLLLWACDMVRRPTFRNLTDSFECKTAFGSRPTR
jgi:hypothetical protein